MTNKKREIILDTETTGLLYDEGDRIIEIGCVELYNHVPSGKSLQIYFNPETKRVSEDAEKIHGLTHSFLSKQPFFRDKVNEILNFISNDPLVIHNSVFDLGFLNKELERCNIKKISNPIIDTLKLAKNKLAGGSFSLDALCRRFNIDKSKRDFHGALLDSHLLAEVYVEILGGRQADFTFESSHQPPNLQEKQSETRDVKKQKTIKTTPGDIENHKKFIKNIRNPIWNNHKY